MPERVPASPFAIFAGAARAFTRLVGEIGAGDWGAPGLGVWTVRDLVGHASRSLVTVESYLGGAATGELLPGPVAYYLATRSVFASDAVAQRGRDAGAALGDQPATVIAELADRVIALVEASPADATVASPFGPMTLVDYLPTRTFELTVHSLDIARSLGLAPPADLAPAVDASLDLAVALAKQLPTASSILLQLTGRDGLPSGLSVL